MLRNGAVHYFEITRMPGKTLVRRARIRTIFAKGNPGPNTIWGTGTSYGLLHVSLLLFIVGCLVYFFNINRTVFYAMLGFVGIMILGYAAVTVALFVEPHELLHSPLSPLALHLYLGICYGAFQVCSYIPPLHGLRDTARRHYYDLSDRYSNGLLIGKRRAVEEIALKPSSEIDEWILERILLTLDEDRALEMFFDAIPGFCHSKLTLLPLSFEVQRKLRQALDGFLDRTFSSNLVSESVRASRLITCLNAAHAALGPRAVSKILDDIFHGHWNEVPQSVEIGHALRLWSHSQDYDQNIRQVLACIIARVRGRDDRWTRLVKETFGVPDRVFQDYLAHGDSVLLSILIHVSRQANAASSWTSGILSSLSKFDIRDTLPELQHDFCMLWNEIAQGAHNQGSSGTSAKILRDIHYLYLVLHRDTDIAPTASSTPTDSLRPILDQPSSYPLCDVVSHHPDFSTHVQVPVTLSSNVPLPVQPGDPSNAALHPSMLDYSTTLRPAEETSIVTKPTSPPNLSTTSETPETSQAPAATFPVYSNPPSTDGSPPQDGVAAVATAQADTTSAAKLSHPPESDKQPGLATLYAASPAGISGIASTMPAPAPLPAFTPPVLNKSSATDDANVALISKSIFPASSGSFSTLDSPPPPPFHDEELLSLRSGMSPKDPPDTSNAALPPLHPRRLVKSGNVCIANAVLQLFVYCPPFRDLVRLACQCEGGGAGNCATPLIDASVKFLDEFAYKEKSSMAHQILQQAGRNKVGEGEKEDGGVHSFQSTDVYDAMKEKGKFIDMKVRSCGPYSGILLLTRAGLLCIGWPPARCSIIFNPLPRGARGRVGHTTLLC